MERFCWPFQQNRTELTLVGQANPDGLQKTS
jgi:hypothetical protein